MSRLQYRKKSGYQLFINDCYKKGRHDHLIGIDRLSAINDDWNTMKIENDHLYNYWILKARILNFYHENANHTSSIDIFNHFIKNEEIVSTRDRQILSSILNSGEYLRGTESSCLDPEPKVIRFKIKLDELKVIKYNNFVEKKDPNILMLNYIKNV